MKKYAIIIVCLLLALLCACAHKDPEPCTDGTEPPSAGSAAGSDYANKFPNVVNIVNKAKLDPELDLPTAFEYLCEDANYIYSFNCVVSHYITVYYDNGTEENILPAIAKGRVKLADLDKYGITYVRERKHIEADRPGPC